MAHDDFLHSIPPCRDPRGRSAWLSSRAMKGRGIKQFLGRIKQKRCGHSIIAVPNAGGGDCFLHSIEARIRASPARARQAVSHHLDSSLTLRIGTQTCAVDVSIGTCRQPWRHGLSAQT